MPSGYFFSGGGSAAIWDANVLESHAIVPVSVIVPCFNCAKTIGRAVGSILKQAAMPMEIILVDDASEDATLSVLYALAQANPDSVKVLQLNENKGAGSARNAGWAIAAQPYIAFLDADDSWHPEKLCIQYEYMRDNPDVALSGHQCIWLRDNETPPVPPKNLHVTRISAGSLLFRNAFSTPAVMLKRDISSRFQEGQRCAEDVLLWQKIAFAGQQVIRLESPLAYVHKPFYGAGGLSTQLWKMERGELSNFVVLYQAGSISFLQYAAATFLSLIKYSKRLLVTKLKGLAKLHLCRGGIT